MRFRATLYYAVAFLSVLIAACVSAPKRIEPDNLLWPLPPDQPRIKYIQSVYSEDDIGRIYSFREKLFGKAYVDTLSRPYGVSVHYAKIIITDIVTRRVVIFDLATKTMNVLGSEGGIVMPADAVLDATGRVYVADTGGSRISVYDANGAYKTAFLLKKSAPVSIAVNESLGRLYVVDRSNHRVVVFGMDGRLLFEFGRRGVEDGQFNIPLDVVVDAKGDVYVLDSGNFRVQIFDRDGKFIAKFGNVGDGSGMFANPKGIAVDSDGHIYVTDAAFSNFQIFDRNGSVLLFVGEMGPRPGQLHTPGGIAIDENDRIYVADQLNRRIQVFQYLKAK